MRHVLLVKLAITQMNAICAVTDSSILKMTLQLLLPASLATNPASAVLVQVLINACSVPLDTSILSVTHTFPEPAIHAIALAPPAETSMITVVKDAALMVSISTAQMISARLVVTRIPR